MLACERIEHGVSAPMPAARGAAARRLLRDRGRPAAADALPRMDVAGFVGFAAARAARHCRWRSRTRRVPRDLRRRPAARAGTPSAARSQHACLGPAVEAFFANGGRRCWVVRVADATQAVTLSWPLPGLRCRPSARRDPGRSDQRPGPLPRPLAARPRERHSAPAPAAPAGRAGPCGDRGRLEPRAPPGARAAGRGRSARARIPPAAANVRIPPQRHRHHLVRPRGDRARAGRRRRALAGRTMASGSRLFWRQRPPGDDGPLAVENPTLLDMTGDEGAAAADLLAAPPDRVHRLSFELAVWQGSRIVARLSGLGFAEDHPRFWGLLPDDAALFAPTRGRPQPLLGPAAARLIGEAAAPRFPLAAPDPPPPLVLPWGMRTTTDRERAGVPERPAGTALELDGLAAFDDRLFLDPDLVRSPTGALLEAMEAKHSTSLALPGVAADARLEGLHSLLRSQEVSLVAVPDAVHRRWSRDLSAGPPALAARCSPPDPQPPTPSAASRSLDRGAGRRRLPRRGRGRRGFAGASVAHRAVSESVTARGRCRRAAPRLYASVCGPARGARSAPGRTSRRRADPGRGLPRPAQRRRTSRPCSSRSRRAGPPSSGLRACRGGRADGPLRARGGARADHRRRRARSRSTTRRPRATRRRRRRWRALLPGPPAPRRRRGPLVEHGAARGGARGEWALVAEAEHDPDDADRGAPRADPLLRGARRPGGAAGAAAPLPRAEASIHLAQPAAAGGLRRGRAGPGGALARAGRSPSARTARCPTPRSTTPGSRCIRRRSGFQTARRRRPPACSRGAA